MLSLLWLTDTKGDVIQTTSRYRPTPLTCILHNLDASIENGLTHDAWSKAALGKSSASFDFWGCTFKKRKKEKKTSTIDFSNTPKILILEEPVEITCSVPGAELASS